MSSESSSHEEIKSTNIDKIYTSLEKVFDRPGKDIQNAFGLIIDIIQNQHAEHEKLKAAHKQFQQEQIDSTKTLETRFSESYEVMRSDFETKQKVESEKYESDLRGLTEERDTLLAKISDVSRGQQNALNEIQLMKQEIKMIVYNLQGYDDGDFNENKINECVNADLDSCLDRQCSSEQEDNGRLDMVDVKNDIDKHVTDKNTDDSPTNQNHNEVIKVLQKDHIKNISETIGNEKQIDGDDEHIVKSKRTIPKGIDKLKKSLRKTSIVNVAKVKLNTNETMAVRLDRIEEQEVKLAKQFNDFKSSMSKMTKPLDSKEIIHSDERFNGIEERVLSIELFLQGFTISTKNLSKDTALNFENIDYEQSRLGSTDTWNDKEVKDNNDKKAFELHTNQNKRSHDITSDVEKSSFGSKFNELKGTIKKSHEKEALLGIDSSTDILCGQKDHFNLMVYLSNQEKRADDKLLILTERVDSLSEQACLRVNTKSAENLVNDLEHKSVKSQGESEPKDPRHEDIINELTEIKINLFQITKDIELKVSKIHLSRCIHLLSGLYDGENDERSISKDSTDEDSLKRFKLHLEQKIKLLLSDKVDNETLNRLFADTKMNLERSFSKQLNDNEMKIKESISNLQFEINDCRQLIDMFQSNVDLGPELEVENKKNDYENIDIDARIKVATDAIQSSLQDVITRRLQNLKYVEDELEKVTAGLAEKPDQKQLNDMMNELEKSIPQQNKYDDAIKNMIENMKSELSQKMTRSEVLTLMKHLIHGAKEDIQNNSNSLMVGRNSFTRCLGCNQLFREGVNSSIAPKINHNALPTSGGFTTSITSFGRPGRGITSTRRSLEKKSNVLVPLKKTHLIRPYRSTHDMLSVRLSSKCVSGQSYRNC